MPTHNRAHLIGETLRSILAQTFQDFEIVVVDNGSTDGTDRVVAALADPRIRYYWQEDTGLPANSRNVGIRMCRGRYIAFLDSDDLWLPGKLSLQVSYMEAHPSVGLVCTNARAFDAGGLRGRLNRVNLRHYPGLHRLLRRNFISTLTVMIRRDCLDDVGLFNEDRALQAVEDFEFWLRVAARFPVAYLPKVTAHRRFHSGGLAGCDSIANLERGIEMLKRLPPSLPVTDKERSLALGSHYVRVARESALAGDSEKARKAAEAAWRAAPGLKTALLVWAHRLAGRFLAGKLLPGMRSCKYALRRTLGMVHRDRRFRFGENWRRFLHVLNDDRISEAQRSLKHMLEVEHLHGLTFLDVGSGSGLFSLAARRLGARVRSFDCDEQSVACTAALRERYFPGDPDWTIEHASVLDTAYMKSLGEFDVVYAWGVLHHTGALWQALETVQIPLAAGGRLFISIYNDQGRLSVARRRVKKLYNDLPRPLRLPYVICVIAVNEAISLFRHLVTLHPQDYVRRWTHHYWSRGMSRWHDLVDWIGGYPFEVAKPEEVLEFYHAKGFGLLKLKTCGGGSGCNEFVFRKSSAPMTPCSGDP